MKLKNLCLISALFLAHIVCALEMDRQGNSLVIKSKRLELVVENGQVTSMKSGDLIWGQPVEGGVVPPCGLGIVTDIINLRETHMPWGEPTLNQQLPLDKEFKNLYRPCEKSQFTVSESSGKVQMSWKGLTNGEKFLPEAELSYLFGEDENGALTFQSSGKNPDGGIFGIQMPILNIRKDAKFILASFGGMEYECQGIPGVLPFGGSPFAEAPIFMFSYQHKTVSAWMENPSCPPYYVYFTRNGKTMAAAFESNAIMPYEKNKSFVASVVKIDSFNGDWKAAATPYRNWFQKVFAKEIKQRDSLAWANNIYAIFDVYVTVPNDKTIATVAKRFNPENVVVQIWNARAGSWDRDFPDWTPRKGLVEGVKRLHKHGFKVMGYVNTYCANYLSPFWIRDNLSSFFLTRKNALRSYVGSSSSENKASINEKLLGTVDYTAKGEDQFKNIPKGRLLYCDPLCKEWRTYHINMMKTWNKITGIDANYEDCAGTVGDHGNGTIDGLTATEGSIAALNELQQAQPNVAIAAEYGPAGIAHAVQWPLNYASYWGYDGFKRYRASKQIPLNTYVFGYRQWISGQRTDRDLICYTTAAVSDAIGGFGFANYLFDADDQTYKNDFSFRRHLTERSKIFIDRKLKPFFPDGDYPENVRCMYKGRDGIYKYVDDGVYQRMLSPDGKELYGRMTGGSKIRTTLKMDKWPFYNGKEYFALDPEAYYPFYDAALNPRDSIIQVPELSDNVICRRYWESEKAVMLQLEALPDGPEKAVFSLKLPAGFTHLLVNGKAVENKGRITAALPVSIVAFSTPAANVEICGELKPVEAVGDTRLFLLRRGFRHFMVKVPADKEAAMRVLHRNRHTKWPYHLYDATVARVYINGKMMREFDSLIPDKNDAKKFVPDINIREWILPLAEYAGKTVLITLETDAKATTNYDDQVWSFPEIVKDPEQKFKEKVISPSLVW